MTIEEYREIRNTGKNLSYKILDWKKDARQEIIYAAKMLGFWNGQVMVFDSDDESDVLMDFLIYEKGKNGAKLIEMFFESDVELEDLEEEILEGMIDYQSSLFEITSIDRDKHTLQLVDLFDKSHKQFELMDIGFSQTAKVGLIVYTRLIPIRNTNMTSGVSFGFDTSVKDKLLNELSFEKIKRKGNLNSTDLFVIALKKSKRYGITVVKMETT